MDYKLENNVSPKLLKNYGYKVDNYVYILMKPVYSYNKKPVLFTRYMVNLETKHFTYIVVKASGETYESFYNQKIQSDVVDIINKKIKSELISMSKHNIIKKIKKKEN